MSSLWKEYRVETMFSVAGSILIAALLWAAS